MLFSSWQLRATAYFLYLTLCLAQELHHKCESDFCYETSVEEHRSDNTRLESQQLINDQNERDERNKRSYENSVERSKFGREVAYDHQILRQLVDLDRTRKDFFQQETSRHPHNRNNERFLVNYHKENNGDSRREAERQLERPSEKTYEDNRKKKSMDRQRLQENKQNEVDGRLDSREVNRPSEIDIKLINGQIQRRYINERENRIRQQNGENYDRHTILRQTDNNKITSRTEHKDGRQYRKETEATQGREENKRKRDIKRHADDIFWEVPSHLTRFNYRGIQNGLPSYLQINREKSKDATRKQYRSRRSVRETERNFVNPQADLIPLKYSEILKIVTSTSKQPEATIMHSRNQRKFPQETLRQSDVNESENYRNTILSEDRDIQNERESMEWREYGEHQELLGKIASPFRRRPVDRHETLNRFDDLKLQRDRAIKDSEHNNEILDKNLESLKREKRLSANKFNYTQLGDENEQDHRLYNLQDQHNLNRPSDNIRESHRRTERISHDRLEFTESPRLHDREIRDSNGWERNLEERVEISRHPHYRQVPHEKNKSVENRRNYPSQLYIRSSLDDSSKSRIAKQRFEEYVTRETQRDAIRSWESEYRDIAQQLNEHDGKRRDVGRENYFHTTDEQEIRRRSADAPEIQRSRSESSEKDMQHRNENNEQKEHREWVDKRTRESDVKNSRDSAYRSKEMKERIVGKRIGHQRDSRLYNQSLYKRETPVYMKTRSAEADYRNNRFIEEDDIQKPTVLTKGCVALGQSVIIAYVFMKTLYAQKDLKNQLPVKLGEVLGTIRF